MEIIKFRAWDKKLNKYWSWEELQHLPICDFNREDLIWQQFTGLHDKNGKEIYEGDILKYQWEEHAVHGSRNTLVKWQEIIDSEYAESIGIGWNITTEEVKEQEIIGNIYENPELLNVK